LKFQNQSPFPISPIRGIFQEKTKKLIPHPGDIAPVGLVFPEGFLYIVAVLMSQMCRMDEK